MRVPVAALAFLLLQCTPNVVVLRSHLATGFHAASRTVSVLGVYKDGRLRPDSGGAVPAPIARALGGRVCAAGFSEAFVGANPELSAAIDHYARANGPTEEL